VATAVSSVTILDAQYVLVLLLLTALAARQAGPSQTKCALNALLAAQPAAAQLFAQPVFLISTTSAEALAKYAPTPLSVKHAKSVLPIAA
jgi:hypothetical protein